MKLKLYLFAGWMGALAVGLTGCGGSSSDTSTTLATNQNLVSTTELNATQTSQVAASSRKMTYTMPAINGGSTTAVAAVFVPKGTPPAGGWPIVAWAHGTVGVADGCEPSGQANLGNSDPLTAYLVNMGYMVVAPDYEGLGNSPERPHPYLRSVSEARSMLYAATAAKQLVPEAGSRWLILGHSQGGHAALATAELLVNDPSAIQQAQQSGLSLRGVVAMAPASNIDSAFIAINQQLQQLATTAETNPAQAQTALQTAGNLLFTQNLFGSLVVAGEQAVNPSFKIEEAFGAQAAPIAATANQTGVCLPQLAASFRDSVSQWLSTGQSPTRYGGLKTDFLASEAGRRFLDSARIGATTLNIPVLILQGADDTTVFPQLTDLLTTQMQQSGNAITAASYGGTVSDAQAASYQFAPGLTYIKLGQDPAAIIDHNGIVPASTNLASRFIMQQLR